MIYNKWGSGGRRSSPKARESFNFEEIFSEIFINFTNILDSQWQSNATSQNTNFSYNPLEIIFEMYDFKDFLFC